MEDNLSVAEKKNFTIELAREVEDTLNNFYDVFAKKAFNCNNHRFHIKGENVASSAFWTAKKRYALAKVYDLETNQDVDKLAVKGLDIVRSSFPPAFRDFMKEILNDILEGKPKELIDSKILNLKNSIKKMDYLEIARNTSANNITRYSKMDKDASLTKFNKSTPIHIKAAIIYNRLIEHFGIENTYEKIIDGAKIKYVYLKPNSFKIDVVAIKGYNDPPQILKLIEDYIDTDALFDNELKNKLEDFYKALNWGNIPTEINQNASNFFEF
jgi:DNA polymerase elongation subunit (family B)